MGNRALTPEQEELQALTKLKYVGKEQPRNHCPVCDSTSRDHEVRGYNMMWGDGDVYCMKCGAYVRMWDSG